MTSGDHADTRSLREAEQRARAEEAALARAAADNEPSAWTVIYERHYDHVFRYVRARVGNAAAEDVAAEVFASAVRSIGSYSGTRPLLAWLYGVAKHRVADHFRRDRPRESIFGRVLRALPGSTDSLEERNIIEALGSRAQDPGYRTELLDLQPALERLTRDQREVLVLRHLVGLSTPEIASAMNRSATSIYSLEARALASVRRHL